jgi:hypothetical protein
VLDWTPAPRVRGENPAAQALVRAGEERFYDTLLSVWMQVVAREQAARAACRKTATNDSSADRATADAAGARHTTRARLRSHV